MMNRPWARWGAWLLGLLLMPAALGCNDNSGDTLVINGLDCGLVRADLFGDWTVTFTPGSRTLVNCDDAGFNGTGVDVLGTTKVYYNAIAFASPSGASFNVIGAGPDLPNELVASVEADSCLSLVQSWENDDQGWVQCFGGLDLNANAVAAVCDSFDLDSDADGVADVACDLNGSLTATILSP